jgi:hypothetical protein
VEQWNKNPFERSEKHAGTWNSGTRILLREVKKTMERGTVEQENNFKKSEKKFIKEKEIQE